MGGENCDTKHNPARRKPTALQRRKMISLAIEAGIIAVMTHHVYTFNGKIYLQTEGGPIGLELSGAIARVFMLLWDRKLLTALNKATQHLDWDLYLYLRYVDDGNTVCNTLPLGARLVRGKVRVVRERVEEDKGVPGDLRTAKIVQEVANSICPFIQTTIDCPSKHPNNLMPILDLEVGVKDDKVVFQHYRKACSNFLVTLASSAMADKQKRVCLTQEVVRASRNCSRNLPVEVRIRALTELSLRLKDSGYSAAFRFEVITAGMTAYERQVKKDETGACPLYRPKGYLAEERRKKKEMEKMSWYRPYDTVLFCPPTPDSALAKSLRRLLEVEGESTGLKIKVVERAGRKLRHQVPGLQCGVECTKPQCFLHTTGGKGDCRRAGCVYRGHCVTCEEKGPKTWPREVGAEVVVEEVLVRQPGVTASYTGESGFSFSVRGSQHLEALENPSSHKDNAFVKHAADYHQGEENDVKFQLEIIGHYSKPVERQVCEGVYVHSDQSDLVMNSKLDHHLPAVTRVTYVSSAAEQGAGRGRGRGGGGRGRRPG